MARSGSDAPRSAPQWMTSASPLSKLITRLVLAERRYRGSMAGLFRWFGARPRGIRAVSGSIGLVAAATTAAGTLLLITSAWFDFQLQKDDLHHTGQMHMSCDSVCVSDRIRATLNMEIKGAWVGLLLMLGTSVKAYDYMMHDNDFCRGCHIFVPSGQMFVRPDTGTYLLVNKLEGKHDTLSCHACHPFELKAQTKELFYWIVQRPELIPPHAKVPRHVCEDCHVQGEAKRTWARIASTAGLTFSASTSSAPRPTATSAKMTTRNTTK